MAHSNITRPTVKDRLNKWAHDEVNINASVWLMDESLTDLPDEKFSPEADLLDKARFKLSHKSNGKKKDKIWLLECKWISKEDYEKYTVSFFREKYTTEWHTNFKSGNKFKTFEGAKNHFRTLRPSDFWDSFSGRKWRIRNTKTDELFYLK